jgi:tetratricopeptide (TPR) repeat protein
VTIRRRRRDQQKPTAAGGQEPPEQVIQIVTAQAGFAYGVINGSIHCFGDGTPVYVLENWRPTLRADSGWLREVPSRLLNARFAVVNFTGRTEELAGLREWRDASMPQLAVRWLYGPGGQGKTRIAAQLAEESANAGWKVVVATNGPGAVLPPPGSQDLRVGDAPGVLLIVDYADRFPLSHLTALLSNSLLHQTGVKTRVLMLARTDTVWPAVRATLANHQAATSLQHLEPLADRDGGEGASASERKIMFVAARDGFARHYDIPDATAIMPPGWLRDSDLGLVLAIHMAALVAVDAHVTGRRLPTDMAGLTIYLLDREHLHWATLYGDGTHRIDPGERTYRTPPEAMNQTVFTAALTGAVPSKAGRRLLRRIGHARSAKQILIDHGVCYPPATPGQATVLEPLYPDRLAEDFLALTVNGHSAEYPSRPWASSDVTTLLDRRTRDMPAASVARAVTFLAAATGRWPHLGPHCLFPLLWRDPRLAIEAGAATLTMISSFDHIDVEILEAIEAQLPSRRHVDLDTGIASLAARLTSYRLERTSDRAEHARLHLNLGLRLSDAGLHRQAHAAAVKAVTILRRLTAEYPDLYERYLARALGDLAIQLGELGIPEEALAAGEEAVGIYRRLAPADPAALNADFSRTLENLGVWLGDLGRLEEALAVAQEASAITYTLSDRDVARSLAAISVRLAELGRHEEALPDIQDAVSLHRRVAADNPAAFTPLLASSLQTLGTSLSNLGRHRDALEAAQEAVELHRRLATANPDAFNADLASSVESLSNHLSASGQRVEALAATEEAVALRRRLAAETPAAFEPGLAASLSNLGIRLAALERREEGLAVTQEAVALSRRLAAASPAVFDPDLARSLDNLGIRLAEMGRREEALTVTQEAVVLRRRLAATNAGAFKADLAGTLSNLGSRLSEVGRRNEALTAAEEAVTCYRQLAAINPGAFATLLATSLNNLGIRLAGMARHEEALTVSQEAVTIRRQLATTNPKAFHPDLASAVNNLAIRLHQAGRRDEALAAAQETVTIYRKLTATNSRAFDPALARSLGNLGGMLSTAGRREESLAVDRESIEIYRRLAAANPGAFEPDLARTLGNAARVRLNLEVEHTAALGFIVESTGLYLYLAKGTPVRFQPKLRECLFTAIDVLKALGLTDNIATIKSLLASNDLTQAVRFLKDIVD